MIHEQTDEIGLEILAMVRIQCIQIVLESVTLFNLNLDRNNLDIVQCTLYTFYLNMNSILYTVQCTHRVMKTDEYTMHIFPNSLTCN